MSIQIGSEELEVLRDDQPLELANRSSRRSPVSRGAVSQHRQGITFSARRDRYYYITRGCSSVNNGPKTSYRVRCYDQCIASVDMSVSLQYSPAHLSLHNANRLLNCVSQGVLSLVTDEDITVGNLNASTAEDIRQVRTWNNEISPVDGDRLIHDFC